MNDIVYSQSAFPRFSALDVEHTIDKRIVVTSVVSKIL